MQRFATFFAALTLCGCTTSAEVAGGDATSVRTSNGVYSVTDNIATSKIQVRTTIGNGSEAAVSMAADQYLDTKGSGCRQTDRLSLGAGYVQGSYLFTYECSTSPQSPES